MAVDKDKVLGGQARQPTRGAQPSGSQDPTKKDPMTRQEYQQLLKLREMIKTGKVEVVPKQPETPPAPVFDEDYVNALMERTAIGATLVTIYESFLQQMTRTQVDAMLSVINNYAPFYIEKLRAEGARRLAEAKAIQEAQANMARSQQQVKPTPQIDDQSLDDLLSPDGLPADEQGGADESGQDDLKDEDGMHIQIGDEESGDGTKGTANPQEPPQGKDTRDIPLG